MMLALCNLYMRKFMRHIICLFVSLMLMCMEMKAQTDCLLVDSTLVHSQSISKLVGDSLYECGHYERAANVYKKVIIECGVSADVYYNLGNAYYKMDDMPRAILNYERALLLDQGDSDICANLALARGKIVDKVTPASEMFFVTWWRMLVNSASVDSWAVISIVSFALMLLGVWVYLFVQMLLLRKIGAYGALAFLFAVIFSSIAAVSQRSSILNRNTAIVMDAVVTVKSSPSDASTDLFLMHGGSKVDILDTTMSEWIEVKLEEGKEGWIPASAVEVI